MSNTTLISLTDATNLLPQKQGRKVHVMTVKRWILRGTNNVFLAAQKVGGCWYTTERWIEEFCIACTRSATRPVQRTPAAKRESQRKARTELERRYGRNGGATEAQMSNVQPTG
jgi:hypothetical protein